MKLSTEQVRHVARLARLSLTPEEEQRYARQLGEVLEHVERLAELDTSAIPPTAHASFGGAGAEPSAPASASPALMREDEVQPSLSPEQAVANAPAREGSAVAVPKIIE